MGLQLVNVQKTLAGIRIRSLVSSIFPDALRSGIFPIVVVKFPIPFHSTPSIVFGYYMSTCWHGVPRILFPGPIEFGSEVVCLVVARIIDVGKFRLSLVGLGGGRDVIIWRMQYVELVASSVPE